MGFSLGQSHLVCPTNPWKQTLNSILHFHFPCLKGENMETCWFYKPCSHTSCSQRAQLWTKNGRIWLLGFFRTDYNRRKRVIAKCHFSIQPSEHSRVGTEGGHKAQQIPSELLVASTSWINQSTSFLSVLEFHSILCFPYLLRKRREGWVCLKLKMSLWYLQGTLRKNAAHCSGVYYQPRRDHIRSAACHKLSVSHLGSAEAHTSVGTLRSFHPGCSWTASVLPKALDWLWKTSNTF